MRLASLYLDHINNTNTIKNSRCLSCKIPIVSSNFGSNEAQISRESMTMGGFNRVAFQPTTFKSNKSLNVD